MRINDFKVAHYPLFRVPMIRPRLAAAVLLSVTATLAPACRMRLETLELSLPLIGGPKATFRRMPDDAKPAPAPLDPLAAEESAPAIRAAAGLAGAL